MVTTGISFNVAEGILEMIVLCNALCMEAMLPAGEDAAAVFSGDRQWFVGGRVFNADVVSGDVDVSADDRGYCIAVQER